MHKLSAEDVTRQARELERAEAKALEQSLGTGDSGDHFELLDAAEQGVRLAVGRLQSRVGSSL